MVLWLQCSISLGSNDLKLALLGLLQLLTHNRAHVMLHVPHFPSPHVSRPLELTQKSARHSRVELEEHQLLLPGSVDMEINDLAETEACSTQHYTGAESIKHFCNLPNKRGAIVCACK